MVSNQSFGYTNNSHPFIVEWGGHSKTELGKFWQPQQIAVDDERNIYVADTGNSKIQKFTYEGKFLSSWGIEGVGSAELQSPTGIAIYENSVYVVDQNSIKKFAVFIGPEGGFSDDEHEMILKNDNVIAVSLSTCVLNVSDTVG